MVFEAVELVSGQDEIELAALEARAAHIGGRRGASRKAAGGGNLGFEPRVEGLQIVEARMHVRLTLIWQMRPCALAQRPRPSRICVASD